MYSKKMEIINYLTNKNKGNFLKGIRRKKNNHTTVLNRDNHIYVTKPFLPPLDEFQKYLEEIWESKWLTNNGPFHEEFERKLCEYLGVSYISLFANGTLALITALQALRITGEVITTPFSFVATTHALHWNGIKPVFCDIEPAYGTLDPAKIEAAITPSTTAILPVHIYGNPCRVDDIQHIADTYGLKVIYDTAHAFGVKLNGTSICNFGDLSILSFHATKVFSTFEGGAIVCHDEKMKKRIDHLKNFGFAGETTVVGPGINAKMNEFQAALGLLQLKYIDEVIEKRRSHTSFYREQLKDIAGIRYLTEQKEVRYCYPYFPVFIDKNSVGNTRDSIYEGLKKLNIYGRRYFYPLISRFPTYRELHSANPENLPIAEKIAEQVICLPMYPDLSESEILIITNHLRELASA
jgi:dTDP-4-amino-4,6-dideoxygalactose transaminase